MITTYDGILWSHIMLDTYIYIYTYTLYIYMYTHVDVCVCMYVCMYVYIYIYMYTHTYVVVPPQGGPLLPHPELRRGRLQAAGGAH